eukprot:600358-Prymnesium_polylepis.1
MGVARHPRGTRSPREVASARRTAARPRRLRRVRNAKQGAQQGRTRATSGGSACERHRLCAATPAAGAWWAGVPGTATGRGARGSNAAGPFCGVQLAGHTVRPRVPEPSASRLAEAARSR